MGVDGELITIPFDMYLDLVRDSSDLKAVRAVLLNSSYGNDAIETVKNICGIYLEELKRDEGFEQRRFCQHL
nr:MAG TPA: hypothetical protein [Caudoviricetes sp.]